MIFYKNNKNNAVFNNYFHDKKIGHTLDEYNFPYLFRIAMNI